MLSATCFFIEGRIIPFFKDAGKTPEVSDAFISLVIDRLLNDLRWYGIEDTRFGFTMHKKFLIALSDAAINSLNVRYQEGRSMVTDIFMDDRLELCRLSRLSIWIFEEKYLLKSSAKDCEDVCAGRAEIGFTLNKP